MATETGQQSPQSNTPLRIFSGGQTGVDRAALDAAIELGLPHGGWCPLGRRAEDGRIPDIYDLQETDSTQYHVRTRLNVSDSDATLIITRGEPVGGTELTIRIAREQGKPLFIVDLSGQESCMAAVREWLHDGDFQTLNVAGPRESQQPGIGGETIEFLRQALVRPETIRQQ
jgi:hypothetical protein